MKSTTITYAESTQVGRRNSSVRGAAETSLEHATMPGDFVKRTRMPDA